ncbi:MAG: PQQ-binding-like beta-propeller repeat protein, partial [Planctomycetales bacterium]
GERLWEKQLHKGGFMHTHKKNSHASPTPAWDGKRVFVVFMVDDGIFVSAVDKAGNIKWQTKAGSFSSKHGYGSSPVLYKSLVIVNGDNHGSGFLTALDRESGEVIWSIKRTDNTSFATPLVARIDGKDQLLLSGLYEVCSYDPADGSLRWKSEGPARTTANAVGWHKDLVFASGGYPEKNLMAIRADGSGDVVWQTGIKSYVPSPLVVDDRLLVVQDSAVVRCYEPESGEELWSQRVGSGGYSASPTAVGDVVYLPDEEGTVHVFRVGDSFEKIAENKMDGEGMASPAICGGRIYIRTSSHLYCIGKP